MTEAAAAAAALNGSVVPLDTTVDTTNDSLALTEDKNDTDQSSKSEEGSNDDGANAPETSAEIAKGVATATTADKSAVMEQQQQKLLSGEHAKSVEPAKQEEGAPAKSDTKSQTDTVAARCDTNEKVGADSSVEEKEKNDNRENLGEDKDSKEEKKDSTAETKEHDEQAQQQQQQQQQETIVERPPKPQSPRKPLHQSQQPPRLPPNSGALTEIVKSLFGPSVGLCWGDFSCQYNHVRGRLYASTEAVLFYSNLFGFERKILLRYETVVQMQLYRGTSIQVSVQAENESLENNNSIASAVHYVFKGFTDRVDTLQLLIELWQQSQGVIDDSTDNTDLGQQESNNPEPHESTTTQQPLMLSQSRSSSPGLDLNELEEAAAAATPARQLQPSLQQQNGAPPSILKASTLLLSAPSTPNPSPQRRDPRSTSKQLFPDLAASAVRQRSKSVPNLQRRRTTVERRKSEVKEESSRSTPAAAGPLPEVDTFQWDEKPPTKDNWGAWETIKRSANSCLKEVGIEPLELSCSLSTCFKLFLANDAPYSIDKYQRGEAVKDLDVKISPWEEDPSEPDGLLRLIEFRHPVSSSFGLGASHTPTKKRQRLRRIAGCGICMTSSTTVEGVPAADCFTVEDQWLVEVVQGQQQHNSNTPPRVVFSTRFGSNFTKRTFLKGIIQKNINAGNKEWYHGYKTMLQAAMTEANVEAASPPTPPKEDFAPTQEKDRETDWQQRPMPLDTRVIVAVLVASQVLLFLFLLFAIWTLRVSQQATILLLEEMKALRVEHGKVLELLVEH